MFSQGFPLRSFHFQILSHLRHWSVGTSRQGQSLLNSLKNTGCAHAAADAHRDHRVTTLAALKLAQDSRGQLRARAAKRVAQGDGAAVDVDLLRVESEFADDGERLRGKRLVQFNQINLVKR